MKITLNILLAIITLAAGSCGTARKSVALREPETIVVFEPSENTYASTRIPALVMTTKGSLLAFCEARVGTASDWADMDLLMRRSTDKGRTWEAPKVIAPRMKGEPAGNPTPIVSSAGTIHLLFQRNYNRAFYTRSTDDGNTWSEVREITDVFEEFKPDYNWNVLAPGPGHAIQLENGRLLAPVWMANSKKTEPRRAHGPSCVATVYSDDNGFTWKRGAIVADSSALINNPNETMAIQLTDGRVMLSIRHPSKDPKRKAVSYSNDGASNWSAVSFDEDLFEPVCMSSIIRVSEENGSKGRNRIIFVNPDSEHIEKHPRKNLTVKLSYDEAASWPVEKVLEPGPAGYSDLAVGEDGSIYCLYETNTVGKGWNYSLVLKRFTVEWLTDGKDKMKNK